MKKGDTVHVRLTAFTGIPKHGKESVECEVLDVGEKEIYVSVKPPYKSRKIWVDKKMIDGHEAA